MKLEWNPSVATPQATAGGAPLAKLPDAVAAPGDGIDTSNIFAALDPSARIGRIAAAVQGGSYQVSSAATGKAIIEDALAALSGGN
jgi:hypothetical protein